MCDYSNDSPGYFWGLDCSSKEVLHDTIQSKHTAHLPPFIESFAQKRRRSDSNWQAYVQTAEPAFSATVKILSPEQDGGTHVDLSSNGPWLWSLLTLLHWNGGS